MKLSSIKLPSNKKFGYFFSAVFIIASVYLLYLNKKLIAAFLLFIALIIFFTTLTKPYLLLPLNKMWMRLGLCIGKITSPIILGIIFFILFTPYGIFMRMIGRDILRLKRNKDTSYWIIRSKNASLNDFKKQY